MARLNLINRLLVSAGVLTILACFNSKGPSESYNVTYAVSVTGGAKVTSIQLNNQNALTPNEWGVTISSSDLPSSAKSLVYTVNNTQHYIGFHVVGTAPNPGDKIVVDVRTKNVLPLHVDGDSFHKEYVGGTVDDSWSALE